MGERPTCEVVVIEHLKMDPTRQDIRGGLGVVNLVWDHYIKHLI